MAVSWGQALLAGASGVAEYSNQEQQRKQKRIDRTQELRDQMELHRTKSKYAVEMKEYQDNKSLHSLLKTLEGDIMGQQAAIYKSQGYDSKDAFTMASRAIKSGKHVKAPELLKEPEFLLKASEPKRAKSPLDKWVKEFFGNSEPKGNIREQGPTGRATLDPSPEAFGTSEPQSASGPQFDTETQGDIGAKDPESVVANAQVDTSNPFDSPEEWNTRWETQEIDGQSVAVALQSDASGNIRERRITLDEEVPKDAPEWEITTQDTSRGGKKGKLKTYRDKNDLSNVKEFFVPSGLSGYQQVADKVTTFDDGTEKIQERWLDPETNEHLDGDTWISKQGQPLKLVSMQDFSSYMDPGSDKKAKGQFFSDFPAEERESWKSLETDENQQGFFEGNDIPADFPERIGSALLEQRRGIKQRLKPSQRNNPNMDPLVKEFAKARAYIQVLGVEGVKDLVERGGLDKSIFFGKLSNKGPSIQRLQEALGVTAGSDEYNRLSQTNLDSVVLRNVNF